MSNNGLDKEMVERVSWMSPIHYEILQFFDEHDIWITARGISVNINYNRNYTTRECTTLAKRGLLEKDETVYALSDRGRRFLAGDVDASDLEDDD